MPNFNCVICNTGFERPKKRGRPPNKCELCRSELQTVTQFSLATRKTETVDGIVMVENSEPCKDCGQRFMRPKRKGKPPARCAQCKELFDLARVEEVTVSDERLEELFKGDREMLLGTPDELPKGNEAQCIVATCGRIFTSDSACESHKSYTPLGKAYCVDPRTLGMVPKSRIRDKGRLEERVIPIWTIPSE